MKIDRPLLTVALAGNPNSGKTTMFNLLTGARQKVGNYPGVTVERREGMTEHKQQAINVIDLPGIYSLSAYSPEEIVAQQYILNEKPHVVVVVVDSTALERSLYFILQLLELNVKVIIALNMLDEAKKSGIEINLEKLSEELSVQIIPTIAREGKGKNELLNAIIKSQDIPKAESLRIDYGKELENSIIRMTSIIKSTDFLNSYPNSRVIAIKYLEQDAEILKEGAALDLGIHKLLLDEVTETTQKTNSLYNYTPESIIADQRYGYIASLTNERIITNRHTDRTKKDITEITDRILTHQLFGGIFLCIILYATFWFSTTLSETPMYWLEVFFDWLHSIAENIIPAGSFNSLITDGIISGVGSVLSFVPIIGLMFIAISLLEDSGYMARMSYMLDRVFRLFGLHGNSIVALIVSGGMGAGCAVPGVMATRTLRSHKEKIATILTAPLMSCGAKLPVFAVLSAAFFPNHITEALFLITALSWVFVFIIARILRSTLIKGSSTPFLMELPPYRLPTIKCLCIHAWERVWEYIRKAGTVILSASIILWASMSYPILPEKQSREFENKRNAIIADTQLSPSQKKLQIIQVDNNETEKKLEHSYAGRLGKAIEPVSSLAGFDWKINISLVGGFAAKEVIISTLSTAFSMGEVDPEESDSFAELLRNNSSFTTETAISLILFTMLYAPCFITVIIIGREAGIKWAIFSVIFNTVLAFSVSALFYQISTFYFQH